MMYHRTHLQYRYLIMQRKQVMPDKRIPYCFLYHANAQLMYLKPAMREPNACCPLPCIHANALTIRHCSISSRSVRYQARPRRTSSSSCMPPTHHCCSLACRGISIPARQLSLSIQSAALKRDPTYEIEDRVPDTSPVEQISTLPSFPNFTHH